MSAPRPPPKAHPTATTSKKRKAASIANTNNASATTAASTSPAGGDGANRETSTDTTLEQRKRDKKRVQNRLSQQCYREKQASYIRQLERFVESIQSGTGGDGNNHGASGQGSEAQERTIRDMQSKQLRLMKENQELREAILRMRKKLLSLSSAASACADDVIFERILNGPAAGEQEDDPQVKKDGDMGNVRERLHIDTGTTHPLSMQDFRNAQTLSTPESMVEDVEPVNGMAMTNGMNGTMGNNTSNGMNGGIQNNMGASAQNSIQQHAIQSSIQNIQNSLQQTINNSMQTSMQNIQSIQSSLQQSILNNVMQTSIEATLQNSMDESIHNFSQSINASNIPISNGMNPSLSNPVNHQIDHLSMSAARIAALTHSSDLGPMSGSSTPTPYDMLSQIRGGEPTSQNDDMLPPDPRFSSSIQPSIPQSSLAYYPVPTRDYLKQDASTSYYKDTVLDAIESSVRDVTNRMRFSQFRDMYTSPRPFNDLQVAEIDHMTLSDLCKSALRLLLKCSTLEKYVYAVGTAQVLEKVLRWRIAPTAANRLAVPLPFRPTPLQQISVNRHTCIDFIHWGELRDQLIIFQGTYDMHRVMKDTVECCVREVPHLGISIPVLETYNFLEKTAQMSEAEDQQMDPPSPTIRLPEPSRRGAPSSPTTAVGTPSPDSGINSNLNINVKSLYDPNQPYSPASLTTVQLVKKYGLDRVPERKLSPVFGRKWTFLDVASITTRYPVVRAKDLAKWEAAGFVKD